MSKYDQLKLFDDTTYNALVQPRQDQWELFLQRTKSATFDENTIVIKTVQKKKKRKNGK